MFENFAKKYKVQGIDQVVFAMTCLILVICFVFIMAGLIVYVNHYVARSTISTICTMEAKLCPDGSYVSRTGPNCKFAECPTVKGDVTIAKIGQTITIAGVSVSPMAVLQDSRCPIDVTCIQAGTVVVKTQLQKINSAPQIVSLTLGSPTVSEGNKILLKSVLPLKESSKTILSSDYVFDFSVTPIKNTGCTKDADCPPSDYVCEELQGMGTACSSNDPTCIPTHTIIKGECKLKAGNMCSNNGNCAGGNLCHKNVCMSPIGKECKGLNDKCPTDFECKQDCGPPVTRYPNEEPVTYHCELKGYIRTCPICVAKNTMISTPNGDIAVQNLEEGMSVWTINKKGDRVLGTVMKVSQTKVPKNHRVMELSLSDGRKLSVSPQHPTVDGRTVYDLKVGDTYDGANVVSNGPYLYNGEFTYDLLPSGETGEYWANNILLKTTIK